MSLILAFVGTKMMLMNVDGMHISTSASLGVVLGILVLSIIASVLVKEDKAS